MDKPIIEAFNLGKRYRLGVLGARTLREDAGRMVQRVFGREREPVQAANKGYLWALQDVSFAIQPGETIGFVGGNGAGKSTLLKLLARITEPTEGRAKIRGRVAALLEVGSGFHNELTGRENIFLNASILGMSRAATRKKLDEIIDFSGVERYIDTPVKRYSSGMRVRLAFAVAAFLEPDILIADEVLAVGDASFQKRSLGKMNDVAKQGRTVLFVSHDLGAVQNLCKRVIVLRKGKLYADDAAPVAITKYLKSLEMTEQEGSKLGSAKKAVAHLTDYYIGQGPNAAQNLLVAGSDALFTFTIANFEPGIHVWMEIYNEIGVLVSRLSSRYEAFDEQNGTVRLACRMNPLNLSPGRYRLALQVSSPVAQTEYLERVATFEVSQGYIGDHQLFNQQTNGLVFLPHDWSAHPTHAEPLAVAGTSTAS